MGFEINERIKKYRKQKNTSQKEVARRLGIKYTTYCRMESKAKRIEPEIIMKIAKILEIDPNSIIYGENMFDFTPVNKEPIVAHNSAKDPFLIEEELPVTSYKSGSFEISNEEKEMITIFRNVSDDKKEEIRNFIINMI